MADVEILIIRAIGAHREIAVGGGYKAVPDRADDGSRCAVPAFFPGFRRGIQGGPVGRVSDDRN